MKCHAVPGTPAARCLRRPLTRAPPGASAELLWCGVNVLRHISSARAFGPSLSLCLLDHRTDHLSVVSARPPQYPARGRLCEWVWIAQTQPTRALEWLASTREFTVTPPLRRLCATSAVSRKERCRQQAHGVGVRGTCEGRCASHGALHTHAPHSSRAASCAVARTCESRAGTTSPQPAASADPARCVVRRAIDRCTTPLRRRPPAIRAGPCRRLCRDHDPPTPQPVDTMVVHDLPLRLGRGRSRWARRGRSRMSRRFAEGTGYAPAGLGTALSV